MKAKQSFFGHGYSPQKLAVAAVFVCVLFPIIFLALIKSNSHQFALCKSLCCLQNFSCACVEVDLMVDGCALHEVSLQLSIHGYGPLSMMKMEEVEEEGGVKQTAG